MVGPFPYRGESEAEYYGLLSPDTDGEAQPQQDDDDCTHQIAEALNRAAGWLDMPEGDRP